MPHTQVLFIPQSKELLFAKLDKVISIQACFNTYNMKHYLETVHLDRFDSNDGK